MRRYAWLVLACALSLEGDDPTEYRIDASSNAAVVESLDSMTALMSARERRAFHEDLSTALAQDRPGEVVTCGTFITQVRHGEFYPVAEFVRPLHGRTVAEVRAQAAAVREEARRLEAERVLLQAEADQLRPRIESYEAGRRALTAFARQAQLVWSDSPRVHLELTVRNETSRPISEVHLKACVSCRERAPVAMTYRAPRPVAPGQDAIWNVPVPADSPLLEPAPRVDGPAYVYYTRLADPDGFVVHEIDGGADLSKIFARTAVLERRLREIGWPGWHLRPRVDR